MAVDDFTVTITANVAQNATVDVQPGSGVEFLHLSNASNAPDGTAPDGQFDRLDLIDGTNDQSLYYSNQTTGLMATTTHLGKYMANNTNYFRYVRQPAGTSDHGHCLIQAG